MDSNNSYPLNFRERVKEAAELISKWAEEDLNVSIFTHLDADGLSSGGIIARVLERLNVSFRIRVLKQLTDNALKSFSSNIGDAVIFVDFGSGQKNLIVDHLSSIKCLILDHHQPISVDANFCIEVNPHLFGVDGSRFLSSSGVAYLVAREISHENFDLSPIAVVGALGDRQDCGERKNLVGLNSFIVEEAVREGFLEVKFGLRLFGFESRPVVKSLEYTVDPLIPGLSGDYNACLNFMKGLGIPPINEDGILRRLSDLSSVELKRLMIGLVKYMLSKGIESREAEGIMGTIYILSRESSDSPLKDAREYASLLNACGRLGFPSIGILLSMGRRGEVLRRAVEISDRYRHEIVRIVNWLSRNMDKVRSTENLQVVHAGSMVDDRMIGTLISLALSSHILSPRKPIVAFAYSSEGKVKVSARADRSLIEKGLNLGLAVMKAAQAVGGLGGGHDVAAGAEIDKGLEEDFIKILDEIVGKQFSGEV
ncbi:MAG: hypothetical protein DRJ30_03575 [Candidatus Methanomethylicota archaeon]|nr:MAG: hypothetical protein DRJ30_03575 [Candidatus Verstraetearchaeota archaeon]